MQCNKDPFSAATTKSKQIHLSKYKVENCTTKIRTYSVSPILVQEVNHR